jgi:hypothetical protein
MAGGRRRTGGAAPADDDEAEVDDVDEVPLLGTPPSKARQRASAGAAPKLAVSVAASGAKAWVSYVAARSGHGA